MATLQCYNRGCGQKYDPSSNNDDACTHHEGSPVFHDALKGWSCCKKRSTDFTEFLNIPGCTKGPHSHRKPPEAVKQEIAEVVEIPRPVEIIKPIAEPMERPSEDEPLTTLPATVGATLKQALDKQMKAMTIENEDKDGCPEIITIGTTCKNNACKKSYNGDDSDAEVCWHHPGIPIFHEGMKYWSCCKKKTSEFDNFLAQEGCTEACHVWIKKNIGEKKVACRYDWHQTAGYVVVSVFAKCAIPDRTIIQANQVSLKVQIAFDGGSSLFDENFILQGVIEPDMCKVKLLGTKVEISLKKAEPGSWPTLQWKPS